MLQEHKATSGSAMPMWQLSQLECLPRVVPPIGSVSASTIGLVADALEDCSYARLKEQLICQLSVHEETKLNHLLNELMLEDRAPSQLLLGK